MDAAATAATLKVVNSRLVVFILFPLEFDRPNSLPFDNLHVLAQSRRRLKNTVMARADALDRPQEKTRSFNAIICCTAV